MTISEDEIRPKKLFQEYLSLSAADGALLDRSQFIDIPCPACGSKKKSFAFTKLDYNYERCDNCDSLFCSPRPSAHQLESLYSDTTSSRFWSEVFFPTVSEIRKEKLFKPKAKKTAQILKEKGFEPKSVCDVGAGHGFFLEMLEEHLQKPDLFAIEPDEACIEILKNKGIKTFKTVVENYNHPKKFDLVICSEVVEHVYSPKKFAESLSRLVNPGGYLIVTGLGCEGLDILLLQEKSNAIFPPHHLNFMSILGFEILFEDDFSDIEIITPGELDVDILINSDLNVISKSFKRRGNEFKSDLQNLLKKHRLSSHIWAVLKK